MKTLTVGSILLAVGLPLFLYALFFMDTSVAVNYQNGNSFGMPERVVNLDLLAQRQIYVIASIASIIGGIVLFVISKPKAENIPVIADENKKCPQCAELIKKEAKICRFCNYKFTEVELKESQIEYYTKVTNNIEGNWWFIYKDPRSGTKKKYIYESKNNAEYALKKLQEENFLNEYGLLEILDS